MKNQESPISPFEQTEPDTLLSGREAIPVEIALEVQKQLIKYMIPSELLPYLAEDGVKEVITEALTMRWLEKYALDFNGFAEYCDDSENNKDFIKRVLENKVTESDFSAMQTFLEQSPEGGVFFTEEELAEFIKQNSH